MYEVFLNLDAGGCLRWLSAERCAFEGVEVRDGLCEN
jgi:hypothetical protein